MTVIQEGFDDFADGSEDLGYGEDMGVFALLSAARLECLKLAIKDHLGDHGSTMDRAADYAAFVTGIEETTE